MPQLQSPRSEGRGGTRIDRLARYAPWRAARARSGPAAGDGGSARAAHRPAGRACGRRDVVVDALPLEPPEPRLSVGRRGWHERDALQHVVGSKRAEPTARSAAGTSRSRAKVVAGNRGAGARTATGTTDLPAAASPPPVQLGARCLASRRVIKRHPQGVVAQSCSTTLGELEHARRSAFGFSPSPFALELPERRSEWLLRSQVNTKTEARTGRAHRRPLSARSMSWSRWPSCTETAGGLGGNGAGARVVAPLAGAARPAMRASAFAALRSARCGRLGLEPSGMNQCGRGRAGRPPGRSARRPLPETRTSPCSSASRPARSTARRRLRRRCA
jgi:hypothetical protein